MSKKSATPSVDTEIKWTEGETNPGGREPSKKLALELAREVGRILARRDQKVGKQRDEEDLRQAVSSAFDELLAFATVRSTDAPKSDTK